MVWLRRGCFAVSALLFVLMFFALTVEGTCEPGTCNHASVTMVEIALGASGVVVGIIALRLIGWEDRHP
jgi:hypothetical protein